MQILISSITMEKLNLSNACQKSELIGVQHQKTNTILISIFSNQCKFISYIVEDIKMNINFSTVCSTS